MPTTRTSKALDGQLTIRLAQLASSGIDRVGGKNASLGEMIAGLWPAGINVPNGFATIAEGYWQFLRYNGLMQRIRERLARFRRRKASLQAVGKTIRRMVLAGRFPPPLAAAITAAYRELSREEKTTRRPTSVRAVIR